MRKKVPPSVKMEQELYTGLITSGDPLGEAARRGARLILQKAIKAETEQFLGRGWYERWGRRDDRTPQRLRAQEGAP